MEEPHRIVMKKPQIIRFAAKHPQFASDKLRNDVPGTEEKNRRLSLSKTNYLEFFLVILWFLSFT